jgi:hypothetical protein
LFLCIPNNGGIVDVNEDASLRVTYELVTCTICVHITPDFDRFAQRVRRIGRDCFFHIPIELSPVLVREGFIVDVGLGGVKDEASIWFSFQVGIDLKNCCKVPLVG